MACGTCGGVSAASLVKKIVKKNKVTVTNCEYTQEILNDWLVTLKCVKSKNLILVFNIKYAKLNSYIGIVKSAINYSTNPCYFKNNLDNMQSLIEAIKTEGQCGY